MAPRAWLDDIASWFADSGNAARLAKVMNYSGCRELWLQAELAMWLEKHGRLAANGNWDTNLRIANYGFSDLGVSDGNGGYELALEVKVLGGRYQTKVLTGSAGTMSSFATKLKAQNWLVGSDDLVGIKGFGLRSDYRRLSELPSTREKLLLLIIDNRNLEVMTELGEALFSIEFPSRTSRTMELATSLHARLWHF